MSKGKKGIKRECKVCENHYRYRLEQCQKYIRIIEEDNAFEGCRDFLDIYLNPKNLNESPFVNPYKPQYFSEFFGGMWFIHDKWVQHCILLDKSYRCVLLDRVLLQAIETILALTTNEEVVRCYYEEVTLAEFYKILLNISTYT